MLGVLLGELTVEGLELGCVGGDGRFGGLLENG